MENCDKLIIAAIAESSYADKIFNINDATAFIFRVAKDHPGYIKAFNETGDAFSALSKMDQMTKYKLLKTLADTNKLTPIPSYWGIIPHLFRTKVTPIKDVCKFGTPGNDQCTKFKVNIPVDPLSTFLGMQYFRIITKPPVISKTSEYDPTDTHIKYDFTPKVGIRALPEIKLTSNGVEVQPYNYLDLLRFDYELVQDNMWKVWNEMIGHDLGEEALLYNPFLESHDVKTIKYGYQTPKHNQDGLDLHIPLFFDHNSSFESKFNLSSYLSDTLTIEGRVNYSKHLVRARYYDDDLSVDPIEIECEPLDIESFELVSEYFFVDDALHGIMNCKNHSTFVRYWSNQTGCILDKDPSEAITVKGKSSTETYSVCFRPKSYSTDFDKWIYLWEVEKVCHPSTLLCPVTLLNGDVVFSKVGVSPAVSYLPRKTLDTIALFNGADILKPEMPVEHYGLMEKYRVARNHSNFRPRASLIYKFNFNYFHRTNVLSGILPQAKMEDGQVQIYYKFKDEYIDYHGLLLEDWEFVVFRDICNQQIGVDSSLTTLFNI